MEAIRKIQTVENGEIYLQLPKQFWGQEVEIIVLTSVQQTTQPITHKKSLRGCLRNYANPSLIPQEGKAWETVMEEKHERS